MGLCPSPMDEPAICPYCLDSVIPGAVVSELTEMLLKEMNRRYFS